MSERQYLRSRALALVDCVVCLDLADFALLTDDRPCRIVAAPVRSIALSSTTLRVEPHSPWNVKTGLPEPATSWKIASVIPLGEAYGMTTISPSAATSRLRSLDVSLVAWLWVSPNGESSNSRPSAIGFLNSSGIRAGKLRAWQNTIPHVPRKNIFKHSCSIGE